MDSLFFASSDELTVVVIAISILISIFVSAISCEITAALLFIICIFQIHLDLFPAIILLSYNMAPLDILCIGIAVTTLMRFLTVRRLDSVAWCWIALAAVMVSGLVRGIPSRGLGTAVVGFRPDFYFVTAALYMQTFDWQSHKLDRFVLLWLGCGSLLALYAATCWLEPSLTVSSALLLDAMFRDAFLDWRVLPASSALCIAEAGLMCFALWARPRLTSIVQISTVPLFIVAALLHHRSVWVAMVVMTMALMVNRPSILSRLALPMALTALLLFMIWVAGGDGLASAFSSAISEPFASNSSWAWRTQTWATIIPDTLAKGPMGIALGWGYGIVFENPITGRQLANPHNAFVQTFINLGAVGLLALLACYIVIFWRLWRGKAQEGRYFDQATGISLLVGLFVYSIPYSLDVNQGILFGVLAGLASRCGAVRLSWARAAPPTKGAVSATAAT